ncbi:predicted protein [Histoplasma capsulatum H143]|uniref:Uncharacterized protein n=1 Tax=Ajellomyces capsulatus (strain H143) TaxID=544712 RepID=C6HRH7_AJECH|nr:predicted protein [Histoplasma capsulatum H143]
MTMSRPNSSIFLIESALTGVAEKSYIKYVPFRSSRMSMAEADVIQFHELLGQFFKRLDYLCLSTPMDTFQDPSLTRSQAQAIWRSKIKIMTPNDETHQFENHILTKWGLVPETGVSSGNSAHSVGELSTRNDSRKSQWDDAEGKKQQAFNIYRPVPAMVELSSQQEQGLKYRTLRSGGPQSLRMIR